MSRRRSTLSFSLFAFQDIITAVTGVILLITITLAIILITTVKAIPVEDRTRYHEDLLKEVENLASQRDAIQQELKVVASKNAGLSRLSGEELKREVEYAVQSLKVANSRVEDLLREETVLGKAWSEQQERDAKMATAAKLQNSKKREEINHIEQQLSDMRTRQRLFFNVPKDFNKRAWLVQVSGREVAVAPADGSVGTKVYSSPQRYLDTLRNYPRRNNFFVLFVRPSGINSYETIHARLDRESYDFGIDAIPESASIVP